jgi:hypothetical protein
MGGTLSRVLPKPPNDLKTENNIRSEADRLLHSYSYCVESVKRNGRVSHSIRWKASAILSQWNTLRNHLSQKDKAHYDKLFSTLQQQFNVLSHTGLESIDENENNHAALTEPLVSHSNLA